MEETAAYEGVDRSQVSRIGAERCMQKAPFMSKLVKKLLSIPVPKELQERWGRSGGMEGGEMC